MNSQAIQLLKKMLPGLLPLLIFLGVDAIWGTEAGLVVAILFGSGELAVILIKERRFDWFIIFDTGLLVLLGTVSLLSDNDIFFKLKPAFINLIFLAIIGLSAFSDKNLLLLYSKKYLKDIPIEPGMMREMQHTFRMIFWLFLLHTVLILYSAFFLPKTAWAFISSGLLYILFAAFFGWQFLSNYLRRKKKSVTEEWFPLVDEEGNVIGKAKRSNVHGKPGMLHPVVHLHVLNRKGEVYLQKRPASKDVQPGKWDTAVGGHVSLGESVEQALIREAKEELGLDEFTPLPMARYRWDSPVESELVFSYITVVENNIMYNPTELADGRFWRLAEIDHLIGKDILTPNFENEFGLLKEAISKLRY